MLVITNGAVTAHLTDAGAWTDDSVRAHKENFRPTWNNVLDLVAELPVELFNTKGSDDLRCGPCANEFHVIFGLGRPTGIAAGDAAGVALAAVKALYKRVQNLEAQLSVPTGP